MMDRIFNPDNGVFRALGKLIDCLWLSIIFILTCIPIFTIGAAMSSLYYTVQKVIRHDRGYIASEYFASFKNNFKQSTIIWLILLVSNLILFADIKILQELNRQGNEMGKAYIFFQVLMVLEIVWGLYIFPYMARFENKTKNILKNAAIMAVLHLPKTLLLVLLTVVFGLICFIIPIAIFLVPALHSWLGNLILESIFRKYMSDEDRNAEDEMNREYKN